MLIVSTQKLFLFRERVKKSSKLSQFFLLFFIYFVHYLLLFRFIGLLLAENGAYNFTAAAADFSVIMTELMAIFCLLFAFFFCFPEWN